MARSIEATREAKRLYMARKRAENPEKQREYQRSIRSLNPEKHRKSLRDYYARRFFWGRAMKLRGDNRASFKELARLWKKQRGLCALTGRKLIRTSQLDHIIPKARGGSDRLENLRWVCMEINLAKRDLLDDELIKLCKDVVNKIQEVEDGKA
jgi:5-methylcytosine-specific restriction endonuclease McrA